VTLRPSFQHVSLWGTFQIQTITTRLLHIQTFYPGTRTKQMCLPPFPTLPASHFPESPAPTPWCSWPCWLRVVLGKRTKMAPESLRTEHVPKGRRLTVAPCLCLPKKCGTGSISVPSSSIWSPVAAPTQRPPGPLLFYNEQIPFLESPNKLPSLPDTKH
jgi:hypothetical protein